MKIKEILEFLNTIAPFAEAESYDNPGLIIGGENSPVTGVCCCLDITHAVIKEAADKGANLIVSHHPVIFGGLKQIPDWEPSFLLIQKGIAAIAMHTNFDKASGGVNDTLCELLEFDSAGCAEWHDFDGGFGKYCDIALEFSPKSLAEHVKEKLMLGGVRYSQKSRSIRRIAVCCGSGINGDTLKAAHELGCNAIISGDIKHNYWIEADSRGIALIDAGHYGTESHAAHKLAKLITTEFPNIHVFSAECQQDPCAYLIDNV